MAKKKTAKVAKTSRPAKASKAAKRTVKESSAKRAAKSSSAKRTTAKKKPAPKKAQAVTKKQAAKKRPARKAAVSRKKTPAAAAKRKRVAATKTAALGRPRIPGTADLDQMFLKDYEARQVFAFLGVKTVKELEAHPPAEIVERLTEPLVQTVDRIRKALAVNNRCLADDQDFAVQFCKQIR